MDDDEAWVKLWEMTRPGQKRPEFVGLTLHVATETATGNGMRMRGSSVDRRTSGWRSKPTSIPAV